MDPPECGGRGLNTSLQPFNTALTMEKSRIFVNNIRLRAYHGCLPEESIIGGDYRIDVELEVDFSQAAESDALEHTVDYCDVQRIVSREMAIRSKLIEQVLHRTGNALLAELPFTRAVSLRITKFSPPMQGDVESVAVEAIFRRRSNAAPSSINPL